MREQCKAEYMTMLSRVETAIKAKWPETLADDGGVWAWLDNHKPELRAKLRIVNDTLNQAWCNGIINEVKKLTLEWGRLQLEIFKGYADHLRGAA